ncbi:DUF262 domain-containing protein [Aggregatibacter sp. 2125159857]|uniref:DUF262 domain-containing protein n=1 Tax=Aggregatibacter sp. 2125159857 TaxID=2820817 RepID=UPI001ADFFB8B|nr:DUF262 domain-containing protein [Aggregatibacter sp. 2125159857]QTO02334.1 DUF262 domain-containing protein [Aggregatibacter sp. 2125159857]
MSDEKAKILKIKDVFDLKLSIPDYQRPYKWTVKNVQQLIDDLLTHFHHQKQVYRIGTVVIHKNGEIFDIVDGQQRLITLSLLLYYLNDQNKPSNKSLLDETITHTVSKNNIINNYNFIKNYSVSDKDKFKNYILEICEMVRIELDDLDEAFQFFDSQNSKGKPLESYDLLKAYHLREMNDKPKEIIHNCVERWEKSALSQEINNLDKIINYILFRLRRWHYQESGEVFTSDELETFKGVSESATYPYLSPVFATKVVEKLAQQNPMFCHPRFVKTSFQTIQTLINGEQFFDYVQYYAESYEKLFKEGIGLVDKVIKINGKDLGKGVNTFLNNQDYCYRVGDKYLKNLFECIVLFYFDKFGEVHLDEFINKAFLWVYRIRFEYQRITFKTIEDEAHSKNGLFNHIEKSSTPIQVLRYTSVIRENKFGNIDKKIKEVFGVENE